MMAFNAFNSIGRSKTDDPKFLHNEIRQMSLGNNLMEEEINPHIKQSIDSLLGPNSLEEEPMQEERSSSLKMKEETEIRSSILWFPIRYSIPCYCVYNLFSNFGNISCIVAKKERIFVKFRTKEFAAIAITYLINTTFFGNILTLKEYNELGDSWKPAEG